LLETCSLYAMPYEKLDRSFQDGIVNGSISRPTT
jgi:hypothetical protein